VLCHSGITFVTFSCKEANSGDTLYRGSKSLQLMNRVLKNKLIAMLRFDFLPTSTTKQVINHSYYSLSYRREVRAGRMGLLTFFKKDV
jgi:hypothetical protein